MSKRQPATRVHKDDLRRWRVYLVSALAILVAIAFNTSADDTFGLVKYTFLVWGVLTLVVLWVATWVRDQRMPMIRNGLHWPVVALVAWTAIATAASVNPRTSLLGFRGSYDGLFFAVAVALLFFVAVETVTVVHLRLVVSALYFGAGGVVIFYGALQLHDRLTTWGGTWDAVDWGDAPFRTTSIWSTLGNPNHLGGFVAMMLPIGAMLFVVHRDWVRRSVIAVMSVAAVVEALYTTSRGAWLAVLAGLGVLALLLARDLRARPRLLGAGAAALVVAVVLGVLVMGRAGDLGRQFGSIFDPQGRTTTERTELWGAAWRMAADRPLVGWGPDTYRIGFNEYQSRTYVEEFGASNVANGPHNVFFAHLAHLGIPGLLLFLGLLGAAGLRAAGAWRRLGALVAERRPEARRGAEDVRYLLAGLVAASVAFLVQASFNTQQLVLTCTFWVLLALITSVSLDAGVPPVLSPRAVLAVDERPRPVAPAEARGLDVPRRSRPDYGRTIAVASGAGVVALVVAWVLSGPYRADGRYFEAQTVGNRALTLAERGAVEQARAEGARALDMMAEAVDANPWEARYLVEAGNLAVELGRFELSVSETDPQTVERAVRHFREGRRLLARAARLQAGHAPFQSARARALDRIRENAPDGTIDVTAETVAAYREATRANPWDPRLVTELARVLAATGQVDDARQVLRDAVARQPSDVRLFVTLAELEDEAGDPDDARAAWRKVLELTPDHPVAREALEQDGDV